MLALLGFAMVFVFMFLIMTKRMSALVALILIPITFALIGGFYANMGPMMLEGIQKTSTYWYYAYVCYFIFWNYD